MKILDTVINRILQEHHTKAKNPEHNPQLIISKCWNIIRTIIDRNEYITLHFNTIELMMGPLFLFMADPKQITFDDDILMCIKSMMRKMKRVTPT